MKKIVPSSLWFWLSRIGVALDAQAAHGNFDDEAVTCKVIFKVFAVKLSGENDDV